jgi:transcriptional regulator with XRE-family HTH domain
MEDVNARETLAANIRRELRARKWTQTELAKRCNWPQPRLSEVLSAEHSPTLDTVELIATALGVSTSALLLPLPENLQVSS